MNKRLVYGACFSIALAIILGAFGAHALRKLTTAEDILRGFQTGVDYHLFHSGAFLVLGLWGTRWIDHPKARIALLFLLFGVCLFSGSLYVLTVCRVWGWSYGWVGPITPIGGTLLILGWTWLGYSLVKGERTN